MDPEKWRVRKSIWGDWDVYSPGFFLPGRSKLGQGRLRKLSDFFQSFSGSTTGCLGDGGTADVHSHRDR